MTGYTIVWVDDFRNPQENIHNYDDYNIIWCRSYDEFVSWIDSHDMPDMICFDHDLGEGKNGYDCAKYLVDVCMNRKIRTPIVYSQSSNPVGKQNILSYIDNYNKFIK